MSRHTTRSLSLRLITPLALAAALQLPGCSTTTERQPPPPGGAYGSETAGASFEQVVNLVDDAGNEAGYIAAFALQKTYRVPHNPSRLYATTGQGVVFYTDDGGKKWQSLNTPLSSVAGIVDLENGTLVAAGTASNGTGSAVRSLDRGKSWEEVLSIPAPPEPKRNRIEIIKPPGSGQPPTVITAFAYDPFVPDRMYAATNRGNIIVGEQSGKVWHTVTVVKTGTTDPVTGIANTGILEIVPSPHEANEVLIITSTRQMFRVHDNEVENIKAPKPVYDVTYIQQFPDALLIGSSDGALVSRDRGVTWTQLNLPINAPHPYNSVAVAVSPTNPARLLIAVNSVVLRSEDSGQTWSTLSLELPTHVVSDITIDPQNAARVLLITIPISA